MWDRYVLLFAGTGLVALAVVHTVVFRLINRRMVFFWLGAVVFGVMFLLLAGWGIVLLGWGHELKEQGVLLWTAIVLSLVLYWLFVPLYLFAFGIIESSIRIRILSEIANAGDKGISMATLSKKYNTDIIVRKRLKRFLASGELTFDGAYYRIKKRFSFYWLLARYYDMFWRLYY